MAIFKDKEDYFRWVRKRRERRAFRAALRRSIRNRLRAFRRKRAYLKPKFLVSAASVLGAVLGLSLAWVRPGKIDAARPAGNLSFPPPAVSAGLAGGGEKKPAHPGADGPVPSQAEAFSQGRKTAVLIRSAHGSGSGFLAPEGGLVVTCAHILGEGDAAEVQFPSGEAKKARVLRKLPNPLNIALLRLEDPESGWVVLGDSDRCREGEEVVAVGVRESPPRGAELTLSRTRILRCASPGQEASHLEFDGEIHPATAGGPILNTRGEIIGVSLGEWAGKKFSGSRYGLPINSVKDLLLEPSQRPGAKG